LPQPDRNRIDTLIAVDRKLALKDNRALPDGIVGRQFFMDLSGCFDVNETR
jgi:hypothetical protein